MPFRNGAGGGSVVTLSDIITYLMERESGTKDIPLPLELDSQNQPGAMLQGRMDL